MRYRIYQDNKGYSVAREEKEILEIAQGRLIE